MSDGKMTALLERLHYSYSSFPLPDGRRQAWLDAVRGLSVAAVESVVARAPELWPDRCPPFGVIRAEAMRGSRSVHDPRRQKLVDGLTHLAGEYGLSLPGDSDVDMLTPYSGVEITAKVRHLSQLPTSFADWYEVARHLRLDRAGVADDAPERKDPLLVEEPGEHRTDLDAFAPGADRATCVAAVAKLVESFGR